jgi:hypothetical protein
MTQDEIIEMVREAGGSDVGGPGWTTWVGTQSTEFLERFAKFVAAKTLAQTQEPVAWVQDVEFEQSPEFAFSWVKTKLHDKPLYTTPPQRTWVDLTDEEIAELHHEIKVRLMGTYKTEDIYRAIEAKLKELNT